MDHIISPYPIRLFTPRVDRSKLRVRSLSLVNAGHLPGRTMQRTDAAFDYWAFVYISGGGGTYRAGSGPVQAVEAGTLFCLYPGTRFHYGPEPGGYWDEYYFTVEGARVDEWIGAWLPDPSTVRKTSSGEAAIAKMERIFAMMESGDPLQLDQAALLLETVVFELAVCSGRTAGDARKHHSHDIVDGLSGTLHEPFDPAAYAAHCHISLSTLRRIVQSYSGYPLHDYVHRLKAAEAKRQLLNSDLSVREIGETLGYKDPFHFSRLFKKVVGCSPRFYRSRFGR